MVTVICTEASNWWAYLVYMIVFGIFGLMIGPIIGYFFIGSTKNDVSITATFYVRTCIMLLSFVFIAEFFRGIFDVNCLFNFGTAFVGTNTDTFDGTNVSDLRWWLYLIQTLFLTEVISQFFVHTLMPALFQKFSILAWVLFGIAILRATTHNFFWPAYFFGVMILIVWFMMNYAYANIRPVVFNTQHLAHLPVLLWFIFNWILVAFDSVLWKKTFQTQAFNLAAPWLYGGNTLVMVLLEAVAVALLIVRRRSRNGDSNVIYPSYNMSISNEKGKEQLRDVGSNSLTDFLFNVGTVPKAE